VICGIECKVLIKNLNILRINSKKASGGKKTFTVWQRPTAFLCKHKSYGTTRKRLNEIFIKEGRKLPEN
jgi:hypothetical protein